VLQYTCLKQFLHLSFKNFIAAFNRGLAVKIFHPVKKKLIGSGSNGVKLMKQ